MRQQISVQPWRGVSPRIAIDLVWWLARRFCFTAGLMATILLSSGCSAVSCIKDRIAGRQTAVAAPELAAVPRSADRANVRPNRPSREPRSTLLGALAHSTAWQSVGNTVDGRSIDAKMLGSGPLHVLLIGGIHGDEPEGLPVIERFTDEISSDRQLGHAATILIVRNLNPDGTADQSRSNKNGVDLNRNFPASNWESTARQPRFNPGSEPASEPETQALIRLMQEFRPHRILVMHATRGKPMVNYDGPARELAEAMSQHNGYVTSDTIGYPTPGSLGSYAGIDQQIPIITLELPRGIRPESAWQANREALYHFVQ